MTTRPACMSTVAAMDDSTSSSITSLVSDGLLMETPVILNDFLTSPTRRDVNSSGRRPTKDEPLSSSQSLLTRSIEPSESTFPSCAGSSLPPLSRTPIKATSFDGRSIYFARRNPIRAGINPGPKHSPRKFDNMLEVPMHRLMEQLSAVTAAKSDQTDSQKANGSTDKCDPSPINKLWVERYKPRRFIDLLGDERVHRETLSWVKQWDYCVFGKKKPKAKQRATVKGTDLYDYEDEYYRPREKILLLSGPPGLGKTTLAHVVAAHAGYQAMEINASDARSAQVVDDRIRPALESGAAVGSKKPVLLIVDEIDGATGGGEHTSGFVQRLIQLTLDKPKRKTRKNERRAHPQLRPIIAICNDLYASSLARLRQHARIIRFNRPADVHLVKRLRNICEFEDLRADSRALSALVGIAQGDMRGCLNTLQFVKSRNQEVTEPVVRSATAGMKEGDTSLMSVLNDLFIPLSKRRVNELGLTEAEEAKYVDRLSRDVEASGLVDKLANGCFEHYLKLHVHDPTFKRYEDAHEWFSMFDVFSGMMKSEREYALMHYLPYSVVPFYSLFAERGGPRPDRPKADWEYYMKTKTNEEICNSVCKAGMPGQGSTAKRAIGYKNLTAGDVLKLEFLPFLNRIISPPLRPVNSHLVRPEERALMKRLVEIMVSLELRYVQEKTEEGALMYRLDPPIDVFVTYDGKRAPDIAVSRYAVRHLVSTEIDAQLTLVQAEFVEKGQTNKRDFFKRKRMEGMDEDPSENPEERDGDGKLLGRTEISTKRKLPAENDTVDKPPVDFFGRPIAPPVNNSSDQTAQPEPPAKKCKVVYHYKEGNSSAVRKPVKIEALL